MEDFPRTEQLVHRFVAIPLGALYTIEDADYIAATIGAAYEEVCGSSCAGGGAMKTWPVLLHINYFEQGPSLQDACRIAKEYGADGVEFRQLPNAYPGTWREYLDASMPRPRCLSIEGGELWIGLVPT